jgi:hypothetical protein
LCKLQAAERRDRGAGSAIDAYIDPAHKEWRISHPFPQKTRKWMGHGRSISGPDQYRMSMRRKREMIGKWRERNLRSAFEPAAPLLPVAIAWKALGRFVRLFAPSLRACGLFRSRSPNPNASTPGNKDRLTKIVSWGPR